MKMRSSASSTIGSTCPCFRTSVRRTKNRRSLNPIYHWIQGGVDFIYWITRRVLFRLVNCRGFNIA